MLIRLLKAIVQTIVFMGFIYMIVWLLLGMG